MSLASNSTAFSTVLTRFAFVPKRRAVVSLTSRPWICKLLQTSPSAGELLLTPSASHSRDEAAEHLDPNYCGPCYGAPSPANAQKAGCCNTCEEVREAYAQASWAFGKGENVEQCTREHYAERLEEQRQEGCRIEGNLRVNKVVGNFHLAPGRSFSNGNMHVHDLKNYWDTPSDAQHDFTHTVHSLRFGPQLPDTVTKKMGKRAAAWTNHHGNPLDNTHQETNDPNYNFMYFVKIVPTSYLALNWQKGSSPEEENSGLGLLGQGSDGSVETHQYSVTSHKRSLAGGDDSAEGHQERLHSRGGIPGVFFSYVSSSISMSSTPITHTIVSRIFLP
ncbi:hypothetical protein CaCOL14_002979 [Colletotrichum acutatum]